MGGGLVGPCPWFHRKVRQFESARLDLAPEGTHTTCPEFKSPGRTQNETPPPHHFSQLRPCPLASVQIKWFIGPRSDVVACEFGASRVRGPPNNWNVRLSVRKKWENMVHAEGSLGGGVHLVRKIHFQASANCWRGQRWWGHDRVLDELLNSVVGYLVSPAFRKKNYVFM